MENLTHIRKVAIISGLIVIFSGLVSMCAFGSEKDNTDNNKVKYISELEMVELQKLNVENELLLTEYFQNNEAESLELITKIFEFYSDNNELIYREEVELNDIESNTQLQSMMNDSDHIMDLSNTSYFVYIQ